MEKDKTDDEPEEWTDDDEPEDDEPEDDETDDDETDDDGKHHKESKHLTPEFEKKYQNF